MMRIAVRTGLLFAAVAFMLACGGVLDRLNQREWLIGAVRLDVLVLIWLVGASGFVTVRRMERKITYGVSLWLGMVSALTVSGALAMLMILQSNADLTVIFVNFTRPLNALLTPGFDLPTGILLLMAVSIVCGGLAGGLARIPSRISVPIIAGLALTVLTTLPSDTLNTIVPLADSLAVGLTFLIAYAAVGIVAGRNVWVALLVGILNGVSAAIVVIIIGVGTGLSFGPLQAVPTASRLVDLANSTAYIGIFALFGIVGAYGAFVRFVPGRLHILLRLLVAVILSLGVLGTQPKPSLLMVLVIGCIYVLTLYSAVVGRGEAARMYRSLSQGETQIMRAGLFGIAGLLLLSLPILLGSYLTSIINLVGLYVILGVGLGVVVGDAGLLNLGYVAFMAIGAYVTGLLTTPTLLTCGGLTPPALQSDALSVACPGLMSFWQAAPLAVGGSTLAGLIVGLSALHVRGEHLAIVTLGFGEIARIVLRADDFRGLFGAAQGITGVTRPILDLTALNPAWRVRLDSEGAMYYLILGCIVLVIFVAFRLRHSRIGRAWRAMRADEVVAQAMGVHVSRAKLLAFVLGAACAGLAGAIQTVRLYGAYPDSFTLQVTISVLALVMIAGAGSITGVIVGALLLIGLPELLRELIDYRLLAFGVLLIAAMWLYPGTMLTRGRVWKRSK